MRVLDAARAIASERGKLPCCEFVARVLRRAADSDDDVKLADGEAWWDAMMIMDPLHPFSNVPATYLEFGSQQHPSRIVENGSAEFAVKYPAAGRWHALQGWSSLPNPRSGHKGAGHNLLYLASAINPAEGWFVENSLKGGPVIADPHAGDKPVLFTTRMKRYVAGIGIVPLSLSFQ